MMLGLLRLAIIYLVIINLCTFVVFLWDKVRAKRGEYRVSESSILLLSALGGTPAAFVARSLFRHKTRKQPFGYILIAILIVQILSIVGIVLYRTSSQVF